jgi:hypothetical protein
MFKSVSNSLILRGVLALIAGIIAPAWPGATILALVILFAVYAFMDVGFEAMRAFGSGKAGPVIGSRWSPRAWNSAGPARACTRSCPRPHEAASCAGGAGCPSESFVGSHLPIANGTRESCAASRLMESSALCSSRDLRFVDVATLDD